METILTLATVLIGLIAYLVMEARRQQRLFEKQFPPISDAEFLSKCAPGTNPEIALKVRRIVAENLGLNYDRLYPKTRFTEDLGVD